MAVIAWLPIRRLSHHNPTPVATAPTPSQTATPRNRTGATPAQTSRPNTAKVSNRKATVNRKNGRQSDHAASR